MKDTKKETKIVPKLRFKEFEDAWSSRKLATVFDHIGGTALEKYVSPQGRYNFISIGNYTTDGKYNDTGARIVLNEKTKTKLLEQGNLAMVLNDKTASGDIIGSSILIDENDKYIYNQRTERLIVKEGVPSFLWHFLNSSKFRKRIYKISQGGTQIYVNYSAVEKLSIILPQINEQQKIASFLTAVDKRIEQLTKKKKLLEEYKKGVMQKIFNQEIRFKDENGNDFPEWEEKRLGEIGTTYSGLNGKSAEDFGLGKPFITYMQIFTKPEIDPSKMGLVNIRSGEKQNRVEFGDVLFTTSSETPDQVGFASVMLSKCSEVYLNSFCFGFRINDQKTLSSYFAQYLFKSTYFRKLMYKLAQGSTRYNLSKNEMLKHSINIPTAIEEQNKIFKLLHEIDITNTKNDESIKVCSIFKKGLLQQLFI